jgi:hypothetical protein
MLHSSTKRRTPATSMSCGTATQVARVIGLPSGWFALPQGADDPKNPSSGPGSGRSTAPHDDLPYRVELWSEDRSAVEQVLAVTANSSIGYAAYHAATREHPDRYVTLRHRNRVLSRWNAQP